MKRLIALFLFLMLVISICPVQAEYTDAETIKAVQQALKDKGYYRGDVSGIKGNATESAIRNYQQRNHMKENGQIDDTLLEALKISTIQPNGSKEKDVYSEEIRFLDIPWEANDKEARSMMIATGFADPDVTYSWSLGATLWPEDEDALSNSLISVSEPELGREKAVLSNRVTPLKKVGGYELVPTFGTYFSYLGSVDNGVIKAEPNRLFTVVLAFKTNGPENAVEIYADLLQQLEKRYGKFEVYANSRNGWGNYDELIKLIGNVPNKEGWALSYAVKYGQNDTAALLIINYDEVQLCYAKTTSYKVYSEMKTIIEAQQSQKESIGL